MSTNIVKGMAIAGWHKGDPALQNHLQCFPETQAEEEAKMRAALLWLADNVPFEMIRAAIEDRAEDDEQTYAALGDLIDFSGEAKTHTVVKSAIAAAIRAAAGEEGK